MPPRGKKKGGKKALAQKKKSVIASPLVAAAAAASAKTGDGRRKTVVQNSTGKFIGGAAAVRAAARSRATRIVRPDEKQRLDAPISNNLNPFERFYAGLLRSQPTDFLPSTTATATWRGICERLRLPVPEGPLPPVYPDGKQHFAYRAALVIEESRHAIAEGMAKFEKHCRLGSRERKSNNRWQHNRPGHSKHPLRVQLTSTEARDKSGNTLLYFSQEGSFTPEELDSLRPGTIFACSNLTTGKAPAVANSILGCILPSSRNDMIEQRKLGIMIFVKAMQRLERGEWELTPLASLVTQQRMFEACTAKSTINIPFLHPLLGGKGSTHTRFDEDGNDDTVAVVRNQNEKLSRHDNEDSPVPIEAVESFFSVPNLNAVQEKAAKSFLHSDSNTITLVQGPPGTGKTTLLVSVICRYIVESIHKGVSRSLMVCAPTNKAVSVLCDRFVNALSEDQSHFPCSVILVGDDDKLVNDMFGREHSDHHHQRDRQESSALRPFFLYTWTQVVVEEYGKIRKYLTANQNRYIRNEADWAYRLSDRLEQRIRRSLTMAQDLDDPMKTLTKWLKQQVSTNDPPSEPKSVAIAAVQEIIETINEWKRENIWKGLLKSAHVIFCTLASSGTMVLRKSVTEVNDLIVDEAAAATEPEMYIPFQFRPERLLAVGDPKQLPATVISPLAEARGMSRSLHERLMYDCKYKHIMLDVQYRMRPDLSQFPSCKFYDSHLSNGANVTQSNYCGPARLLNDQPYSFLQIYGEERQTHLGSFENQAEAIAVANLVNDLHRVSNKNTGKWNSPDRLRIITFYQAQVSLIKRMLHQRRLHHVLVATVDSSQGCEADIVIVSFVRSHNRAHKASVGFLSDDRRLNVAITRAKYQLICVGNAEHMMSITNPKAETVRALAWDALDRRYITPRPSRLPARLNGSSETRSKRSRSGNAADNPTGPKKQKSNQVETRAVDINKPQLGAEANGTSGEKYTKGEHLQFLNSGKDGGDSSSSSSSSTLSSSSSSSSSDNDAGNAYVGSASDPIVLDDGAVAVKRETAQALDPEVSMEEDDLKVTRHSAMSAPATISPKVKSTVKTEPEYEQTAKERQEPSVVVGFKDISSCKGDTSTTESAHANVVATSDTNSQPPIEKEASTIGDYLDRCYEV